MAGTGKEGEMEGIRKGVKQAEARLPALNLNLDLNLNPWTATSGAVREIRSLSENLIRPEGAALCQPRAQPWVTNADCPLSPERAALVLRNRGI